MRIQARLVIRCFARKVVFFNPTQSQRQGQFDLHHQIKTVHLPILWVLLNHLQNICHTTQNTPHPVHGHIGVPRSPRGTVLWKHRLTQDVQHLFQFQAVQNHLLILGERLVSFLAQQAADRLQRIFPEQEVIVSIVVPVHETGTMKQSVLLLLVDLIKQFRHQTEKPAKLLLASLRSGSLRFSHRLVA